ncbi:MAG: hypothetical protein VW985_03645 [Gammaproteobacteria bacterium]
MTKSVDYYSAVLEPWFERWDLMTQNEREVQRRSSSVPQLQGFYDAMLPQMEGLIAVLNEYPLNEMPAQARSLMNLALSLAEIAPHVEFYKGASGVPYAFEESRFIAERGDLARL